jgi:general secretion pathway protein G
MARPGGAVPGIVYLKVSLSALCVLRQPTAGTPSFAPLRIVQTNHRHRMAAFTLLELMVSIALLGVLAVIAVRAYGSYYEKVRIRTAEYDIAAMAVVITNYETDNQAYPASLADIGLSGKLDPWGNPYVYYNVAANGKGGARKDHALNPINSDFDLYSMGKDGVTKKQITQKNSLDDIIRARDGAFVGLASDF